MLYEVNVRCNQPVKGDDDQKTKEWKTQLAELSERRLADNDVVVVTKANDKHLTLVTAADNQTAALQSASAVCSQIGLNVAEQKCNEATLSKFNSCIQAAVRSSYLCESPADEIRKRLALDVLCGRCSMEYDERVVTPKGSLDAMIRKAEEEWLSPTLAEELRRIGQGFCGEKAVGHPVHYAVNTERQAVATAMTDGLIAALYSVGRLQSARISMFDCCKQDDFSVDLLETLYRQAAGGTVEIVVGDDVSRWLRGELFDGVCATAKRFADSVLTVFRFKEQAGRAEKDVRKRLAKFSLYNVRQGEVCGESAKRYLRRLAKERRVRPDKALYDGCEAKRGALKLEEHFEAWYTRKLRSTLYPQYASLPVGAEEKTQGDATREDAFNALEEMIGLNTVKTSVRRIVGFFRAQTTLAARGVSRNRPSMHMVFTGNPGTAKTSVARLLARCLEQEGVLKVGRFVEVGRADLVGEYVGQTAQRVRQAFARAKGGLLFIDEAYSLVDRFRGSFGDEAINTIVQEMENNREDTIVVFAGYPEPMKRFLDSNVGLRSRVAFYVDFPDYSAEELCDIALLMAQKEGLTLEDAAKERLQTLFEGARAQADFGNGRYARKVIEQARMAQIDRLMSADRVTQDDEAFLTLCAEDIAPPPSQTAVSVARTIGFGG